MFGLFAEKIYIHIFTFPLFGLALILPTMFTYMGIIAPAYLSLGEQGSRRPSKIFLYIAGLIFPILTTLPFLVIYGIFVKLGVVDPAVLLK